ncbi:hypothetical protein ACP4OV_013594 [Aristida adscensionis]
MNMLFRGGARPAGEPAAPAGGADGGSTRTSSISSRASLSSSSSVSSGVRSNGGGSVYDEPPPPPAAAADEEEDEAAESSPPETVGVAVGKEVKESKANLMWALSNMDAILTPARGGGGEARTARKKATLLLLHVHRPAKTIPFMGANFPAEQLHEAEVSAFRQAEAQALHRAMAKYRAICARVKVHAVCKVATAPADGDLAQGILRLAAEHGVARLVVGAAADKRYHKKMMAPTSKTALSVHQQAPPQCAIWFLCKGNLICTRPAAANAVPRNPTVALRPSSSSRQSDEFAAAEADQRRFHAKLSPKVQLGSFIQSLTTNDDGSDGLDDPYGESSISDKMYRSATNAAGGWNGGKQNPDANSPSSEPADEKLAVLNSRYVQKLEVGGGTNGMTYYKQDMESIFAEAEKFRREHGHAAMTMAAAAEEQDMMEGETARMTMKQELEMAREQSAELEAQLLSSRRAIADLQDKLSEAHCMLFSLERDHDELRRHRDAAVEEAAALRGRVRQLEQELLAAGGFAVLSHDELLEATGNLDESLRLGHGAAGGYGAVYKAVLRPGAAAVAVKVLNTQGMQGRPHFERQVEELSKLRHPNVVPLLGACAAAEAPAIVYELLAGGSLEDRLGGGGAAGAPLSWPDRTRIAAEVRSALVFLHRNGMVHGGVKPANVLLDAGLGSKLAGAGLCRLLEPDASAVLMRCASPGGAALAYMDPELLAAGELRPSSDVYAFGVVLLRLLTGRPAMGLVRQVQAALAEGRLPEVLDAVAGEWPYGQEQAEQLAQLAVACCEIAGKNRPELAGEMVERTLGCFNQCPPP